MPAIAEKIYARLMKDPDLDIPYGLTREEFARKEADARERQHRNNAEALSLFKEEIESTINSYKMKQDAKKFYQHGLNADIYNSLPLEAQEKIDKVYKASTEIDTTNKLGSLIGKFFQNAKNLLQSETNVDFGNFEATDEIKNVLNDIYTNILDEPIFKDDNQMKMYTDYNNVKVPEAQNAIADLIKEIHPESKIEPAPMPKAQDETPEETANKLKQTLQDTTSPDAPQSVDDLLAEGVAPKPKNLDTDSFKREDVPYSTYMQGGKAHQLASQYGLTDADGTFNKKGHALINYAKKNGLKTTKSFSPKEIKYTKDKKYVLNEKSVQEIVNFYEKESGNKISDFTDEVAVPKGLKGGLTLAELKANPDLVEGLDSSEIKDAEKIQSASALSDGQTVEEKLKAINAKAKADAEAGATDVDDEPTETEQLEEEQDIESFEAGAGQSEVDDKTQKLIDQAEESGLLDYIHEVVEGHGDDNPYHTKEDTINELKEKKDLQKYLGKMHNKQKVSKEAEEAKQQKTEEAQAAKEEAAKAKEEAAQEKAKLKEMKDEAKAVPQFEDAENMNHHAMNLVHHLSKYKDYMSAKEKKALAQSLSDTFDSDKTPVKGKVADKEFINDHMNEVGYENLGGDDHQEEIDYYATHSEHVEEQYEKLHSNEDGMQSKKDAFESKDHNAHTNFDDDGNPTGGHTTKVHDGEGKVTDFADNSSKFDSGHDGIHHLNHELDDNQKFDFGKYKEAMKAGDTEAAEVYKKDLIDSGIPKQAFDGEGSGGFDDKYPDPEVAKKKLAEGYVFNEATRHWILRENLEGAQGGMGAHDAEVHSSSSTNEKGQAFALNPDGTPHEGNFMVSSAGVHKLGDSHDAAPSKSAGMTMGQTKSNALSHAFSNSSLGKKHQAGGVTKLKGALHPKGSASAVFSGKSGGLLHGTGLEHAKNSGLTSQSYKTAQTKKQASKAKSQAEVKSAAVDASKQIGKYSALGYSPQVAKFLGKVGKNLAAKVKKIKQAKAPEPKMSAKELKASQAKVKSIKDKVSKETGTGKVEKSLDKFNEFIRKTKV
mgnify:CR=1 FL=1